MYNFIWDGQKYSLESLRQFSLKSSTKCDKRSIRSKILDLERSKFLGVSIIALGVVNMFKK